MSASEKATDIVADAAEEVADQATNFAEFARQLNRTKVQFAVGGWILGAVTGAFFAYKFAYSRAETKYSKIVDDEIAEMRRHYVEKGKALEAEVAKRPVEEIVKERGYSEPEEDTPPPMIVKPPVAVNPPTPPRWTAEEEAAIDEANRKFPAETSRNVFEEAEITHKWDWHAERRHRSPDAPYVIHVDEKEEMDYQTMTLTLYEGDNVLCREDDSVIGLDERNEMLGEHNLARFGHGSNDASIVYIRNDKLELVFEVIQSDGWYAETVHGFAREDIQHTNYSKNLERMRVRERDEQDE